MIALIVPMTSSETTVGLAQRLLGQRADGVLDLGARAVGLRLEFLLQQRRELVAFLHGYLRLLSLALHQPLVVPGVVTWIRPSLPASVARPAS